MWTSFKLFQYFKWKGHEKIDIYFIVIASI